MYHLHAKILRRADGRSATAAAAYRSASKIKDQRTGQTWDFTDKKHVHPMPIALPDKSPREFMNREVLWNAIEMHSNRHDSQVAREIEVALPHGLTADQEGDLVQRFSAWLVSEYKIAVDPCIHRTPGNHHAHLLTTTSTIGANGIGLKVRCLDAIATKKGDAAAKSPLEVIRESWEHMVNEALDGTGRTVDRRTLAEQGIDRSPQRHQGPAATGMKRRGAQANRIRQARNTQTMEERNVSERRVRSQQEDIPDAHVTEHQRIR
jgi:hypothetical protein